MPVLLWAYDVQYYTQGVCHAIRSVTIKEGAKCLTNSAAHHPAAVLA